MRLHRPQISLKHLLFAVAILAMNCAAHRYLFEELGRHDADSLLATFPEGFVAGVIPLLNFAAIGSAFFVVRSLRSRGRAREACRQQKPAGATFFSLHFFALSCVAAAFMPDTIALEQLAAIIPQSWLAALAECARSIPDELLVPVVFGLCFSGPLLILSWFGGLLARHSAATLSARRFKALAVTVSLGFASIALAIWVTPRPFADDQDVDLDFRIVDSDSTQAISAASLRLINPFDASSTPPSALSDTNGCARIKARLPGHGERIAFMHFGAFSPWGRWLEVCAANYRTTRLPLPQVLGRHVVLGETHLQTVALTRGKTPEDAFRDIAGCYTRDTGYGGSGFRIEPDGRFSWSAWGCTPPSLQEYGSLNRTQDSFQLEPIPHPGEETHPLVKGKFRRIEWGECAYFTFADDANLTRFCRASLTPNHPRNFGPPIYCRESDLKKPQTSLPRLPTRVWVRFLFQEASLQNEDGLLRLGIERFLRCGTHPGTPRTDL